MHSVAFSLVLFAKLYCITRPCWSSPLKPTSRLITWRWQAASSARTLQQLRFTSLLIWSCGPEHSCEESISSHSAAQCAFFWTHFLCSNITAALQLVRSLRSIKQKSVCFCRPEDSSVFVYMKFSCQLPAHVQMMQRATLKVFFYASVICSIIVSSLFLRLSPLLLKALLKNWVICRSMWFGWGHAGGGIIASVLRLILSCRLIPPHPICGVRVEPPPFVCGGVA